ncbi:hypothetical protein A3Q56_01433 [Intoshia linei]|uniref:Uncharacterized protein n=1 Tax=Intoshia linei TaxID=1819745 RepID=A0A177BBL6_9BILA|nr:hypothetical protein A3Q56_01433 [Intoshia linei]
MFTGLSARKSGSPCSSDSSINYTCKKRVYNECNLNSDSSQESRTEYCKPKKVKRCDPFSVVYKNLQDSYNEALSAFSSFESMAKLYNNGKKDDIILDVKNENFRAVHTLLDKIIFYKLPSDKYSDYQINMLKKLQYCANRNLAKGYLIIEEYTCAFENYRRALELDDTNINVWYEMGICCNMKEKFVTAKIAFTRALELNEFHLPSIKQLILVLTRLSNFVLLKEICLSCIDLYPSYTLPYQALLYLSYKFDQEFVSTSKIKNIFKGELYLPMIYDCAGKNVEFNIDNVKYFDNLHQEYDKKRFLANQEFLKKPVPIMKHENLAIEIEKLEWENIGEKILTLLKQYINKCQMDEMYILHYCEIEFSTNNLLVDSSDSEKPQKVSPENTVNPLEDDDSKTKRRSSRNILKSSPKYPEFSLKNNINLIISNICGIDSENFDYVYKVSSNDYNGLKSLKEVVVLSSRPSQHDFLKMKMKNILHKEPRFGLVGVAVNFLFQIAQISCNQFVNYRVRCIYRNIYSLLYNKHIQPPRLFSNDDSLYFFRYGMLGITFCEFCLNQEDEFTFSHVEHLDSLLAVCLLCLKSYLSKFENVDSIKKLWLIRYHNSLIDLNEYLSNHTILKNDISDPFDSYSELKKIFQTFESQDYLVNLACVKNSCICLNSIKNVISSFEMNQLMNSCKHLMDKKAYHKIIQTLTPILGIDSNFELRNNDIEKVLHSCGFRVLIEFFILYIRANLVLKKWENVFVQSIYCLKIIFGYSLDNNCLDWGKNILDSNLKNVIIKNIFNLIKILFRVFDKCPDIIQNFVKNLNIIHESIVCIMKLILFFNLFLSKDKKDREAVAIYPWLILYEILKYYELYIEKCLVPVSKPESDSDSYECSPASMTNSILESEYFSLDILIFSHDFLTKLLGTLCKKHCNRVVKQYFSFCIKEIGSFLLISHGNLTIHTDTYERIRTGFEQFIYCRYFYPFKKKPRYLKEHLAINSPGIDKDKESNACVYNSIIDEKVLDHKLEELENFIMNEAGDFFLSEASSLLENVQLAPDNVYYLADYMFKNNTTDKNVERLYLIDICLNPSRFDSWAALSIILSNELEAKLVLPQTNLFSMDIFQTKKIFNCFNYALLLNHNPKLWLEYGRIAYCLFTISKSLCRLFEQDDKMRILKNLSLLNSDLFYKKKEKWIFLLKNSLEIAQNCMSVAIDCNTKDAWYRFYMLGKIKWALFKNGSIFIEKVNFLNHFQSAFIEQRKDIDVLSNICDKKSSCLELLDIIHHIAKKIQNVSVVYHSFYNFKGENLTDQVPIIGHNFTLTLGYLQKTDFFNFFSDSLKVINYISQEIEKLYSKDSLIPMILLQSLNVDFTSYYVNNPINMLQFSSLLIVITVYIMNWILRRHSGYYKSVISLANLFLNGPNWIKNVEIAKIFLLDGGERKMNIINHDVYFKFNGLFLNRKSLSWFNDVYRLSAEDLEGIITFENQMIKALLLVIQICQIFLDKTTLYELYAYLSTKPDKKKMYIREVGRLYLYEKCKTIMDSI